MHKSLTDIRDDTKRDKSGASEVSVSEFALDGHVLTVEGEPFANAVCKHGAKKENAAKK